MQPARPPPDDRAPAWPATGEPRALTLLQPGTAPRVAFLSPRPDAEDRALVSCLMVSRGKLLPARFAIECFRRQTHARRELVIVDDNPRSELPEYLAGLADPLIRHVPVPPGRHRLGSLRNAARDAARGELVAQWDDDDLYDAHRLAWQVDAMRVMGGEACFLGRWTLWWPAERRIAVSGHRIWEGSVLARRDLVPDYPDLRRGEDSAVTDRIVAAHAVVLLDAPELYCYVIHGGNTFQHRHFVNIYVGGTEFAGRAAYPRYVEALGGRLPILDYAAAIDAAGLAAAPPARDLEPLPDRFVDPARPRPGQPPSCAEPTVSIIVRSMGRECLADALHSIAAQSYRNLDVVVVDATGGRHPPLPAAIAADPRFRLVSSGRPLKRPAAANFGLLSAAGEYLGFLDDDDLFDPEHVALLMRRIQAPDHPDLVYAGIWHVDRFHRLVRRVCRPFNPLLFNNMNLLPAISVLFHRRMVGLGCRFDESLEVAEDWDFWLQLAPHARIERIDAPTQLYFMEAGTSGSSTGLNADHARVAYYAARVHQRRAPASDALWREYTERVQELLARFYDGELKSARSAMRWLLRRYPSEPNLEFHLGRTHLAQGRRHTARRLFESSLSYVRTSPEFVLTLARLWEALGSPEDGIAGLETARPDLPGAGPALDAEISRLRRSLGTPDARPVPGDPVVGRNAPCPCGSGLRYKECCGRPGARAAAVAAPTPVDPSRKAESDRLLAAGIGHFRRGDLASAAQALEAADALLPGEGLVRHTLALLAHDQGALDEAARHADAARAALGDDPVILDFHRHVHYRRRRRAEAERERARLVGSALIVPPDGTMRMLGEARTVLVLGGSGPLPLGDADFSGWQGRVRFLPADSEPLPEGEAVAWCGPDSLLVIDGVPQAFPPLLDARLPPRVVVRVTRDDPAMLGEIAAAIPGGVGLVFPDETTARRAGPPGVVLRPTFPSPAPEAASPSRRETFRVGLRGSCEVEGLHPSDTMLIRRLLAASLQVSVHGGTPLLRHFPAAAMPEGLRLLGFDAAPAHFHGSLDCLVLRRAPLVEDEPALGFVAEALIAGCPLICAVDLPGAELIVDGRNGFVVDANDDDAIAARIARLSAEPGLAAAIRGAALATARQHWLAAAPGPWARAQSGRSR